MITLQFLAGWALRSSILIFSGGLLLWMLRVKDPSVRLAAWTAMLCGSVLIPALTATLPKMPVGVIRPPAPLVEMPSTDPPVDIPLDASPAISISPRSAAPRVAVVVPRFNWVRAAVALYALVAASMVLRLLVGIALSWGLLRRSGATGLTVQGREVRQLDRVASPVTLGILRPAVVLPTDWREWDATKLRAVLAHEGSHIRRFDPAVQLLSATHRALLWFSPLTWWLHRNIVRSAEEVSDDAAVEVTSDRTGYAEALLDFMQRGVRGANWQGVPMARYQRPDERIRRILDATTVSRGVTRWSLTAILLCGAPVAYITAAAQPQRASTAVSAAIAHAAVEIVETPAVEPVPQTPAKPAVAPAPSEVVASEVTREQSVSRWLNITGACRGSGANLTAILNVLPEHASLPPVTGAPYSDREIDHVVSLANGTRTVERSGAAAISRDSSGRTRTESRAEAGAPAPCDSFVVRIQDPVAGYTYLLDSINHTAHRTPFTVLQDGSAVEVTPPNRTVESLGTKTILGLTAVGTRTTFVSMRGVTQVTESWRLPQGSIRVSSKTTGDDYESTFAVTELSLAEPDPALFQVPAGFKIVDESGRFDITVPAHDPAPESDQFAGIRSVCYLSGGGTVEFKERLPVTMQPILGAPFSMTNVREVTDVLPDGSRRTRPGAGEARWRDSAGRTRTQELPASRESEPCSTFLTEVEDPVAGFYYVLDSVNHVAHRMLLAAAPGRTIAQMPVPSRTGGGGGRGATRTAEDLGTKTMAGVNVVGTKETVVRPAHKGAPDEAPLTSVTESWRSPELGLEIFSHTWGPRGMESTGTAQNLSTTEPDPSLFRVPAGYQIVDETGPFTVKIADRK